MRVIAPSALVLSRTTGLASADKPEVS